MSHYRSNLRDIEFNLFEVLGVDERYGEGPYAEVDGDTARMLLDEIDRFTRESIWADSFVPTDREPLQLDLATGDVTVPEPLHRALQAFYDAGWHTMSLEPGLGGSGAPPSLHWAATELFAGSHATAMLWGTGPLMAQIIWRIGTAGQRERFAQQMIERRWGGTMVLTEPDAGSDVGAGVTTATRVADNGEDDLGSVWHLHGVKRFITSADYQGHDNTVHLVLARPDDPCEPGTKGLRLFIVPKHLVEEDGSLGARNGVRVTNLEKKMGIKGSATCELSMGLDADTPCVGYLAGDRDERGAGIRQMFLVIEHARMMVGTKAMGTLSTGYLNALQYAKVREQGPDMTAMGDAEAPKVPIVSHPDVRRMLMEQKAHVEGMRALVSFTGSIQDRRVAAEHAGDDDAAEAWMRREDLLLPMVKGYCSEKAYEQLSLSLQTFGGSGFTQDYPIEQYVRDAKIDTLYEGTTAIQSLDLFFRKIARDNGATLMWLAGQIQQLASDGPDHLADERKALAQALEDVQGHLGVHVGQAVTGSTDPDRREELYLIGLHSVALLESLSELVIGWLLLRQADVARAALDAGASGDDAAFYTGKLAVARYWARSVLPKSRLRRELAQAEDGALMDVPVEAF